MNPLFLIPIIFFSILFIVFILVLIVSLRFKTTYPKRADGSISIRYPLPSELKNIEIKKGFIESKGGVNLFYQTYKKPNVEPKALILVIHGIGYGHYYLLPIIDKFVNDGYMVLAYDQYASGCSEGRTFKTMSRGSVDIEYVLKFIENDSIFNKYPLYVFGHSWGGYVAGFSLKYSSRIEKCVDVAGFDNEADFVRPIRHIVQLRNMCFSGMNSFVRIRKIFSHTKAKVYYLQGDHDLVVNPRFAGKIYAKVAKKNPNLHVEILENKGHTPFDTDESQEGQNKTMGCFGTLGGVLVPDESYVDFRNISIVDNNVYQKILNFFEKN